MPAEGALKIQQAIGFYEESIQNQITLKRLYPEDHRISRFLVVH
jgi:hypothetical protein